MQTITYEQFDEKVTKFKLHDRLKVVIIHKENFHKTYVTLSSPLGGIHHGYRCGEKNYEAPAGIAHFLEHKVFEKNGADMSGAFAALEAQVNAFTDHNKTTYLFHATAHVNENIKQLIEMFFYPDFSALGVEKEKNIILEELNMHLDDPYYIQYHTLLNLMFKNHPIKEDILGTNESILKMNESILKKMHEAYYQPEVCTLTIVGDVDAKALKTYLEHQITLPSPTNLKPLHQHYNEPSAAKEAPLTKALDVLVPSVLIGIKTMPKKQMQLKERVKFQLAMTMFMDMVFGKTSDYYETWLDEGLINDAYGLDIQLESTYGYLMIGSETTKPKTLYQALMEALIHLETAKLLKDDFNRFKNQMLGNFIMSLDSLEYIAHETSRYAQDDLLIYDLLDIAQSITFEDVLSQRKHIQANAITSVIIEPKKAA